MPRKLTTECTCDRCGRVWYEDYTEGQEPPATTYLELKLQVPVNPEQDRAVKFEVLCTSCTTAVGNLVDKLSQLKHKSPTKPGAKKEAVPKPRPSSRKKAS